MSDLADVPMAGTMISVARNVERKVRMGGNDERTPDQTADLIWLGIKSRRYAEHGITDDETLESTYLPDSRA